MKRNSEKKPLTAEELVKRYKKRYHVVLGIFIAFFALTAFYLYLNYDYLAFKHFLTSSYIYTDTLDAVYEKELGKDLSGKYYANFDNMVIAVVTNRIRAERGDRYTYLYTPEGLQKTYQIEKEEAAYNEIKVLNNKTLYLRITNFSTYSQDFIKDNIEKLKSRPNLIIDLMDDRGGDIDAMVDISGYFLPRNAVIATDHFRWMDRVYKSNKDQPLKYDKIIILQNKNTASASENMVAALRDNLSNVELVGTKTFGKGIGQFTLPLRRGYAVKATILKWFTPKGTNIQGNGIGPDVEYTDSDIIQFALDRISAK
ncbi:MAG TPA: S41 family peptidase [Clostridia bacterium]|nr:S41 family peptidase [Clostridia bacterium]